MRVAPHPENAPAKASWEASTLSCPDGSFDLPGVPPATSLRLSFDDGISALLVLDLELGASLESAVLDLGEIQLGPSGTLAVLLLDPEGETVDGATVSARAIATRVEGGSKQKAPRPSRRSLAAGGNGTYFLDRVPQGRHELRVRADGYANELDRDVEVADWRKDSLVLRLRRGCQIAGVVRDPSAQPIAGARLTAIGELTYRDISTDAEGKFSATNLLCGKYTVRVEADGFAGQEIGKVPAGTDALEITLLRESAVAGSVLSASDGRPIEHATVRIGIEKADGRRAEPIEVRTDADGRFEVRGLSSGFLTILCTHDDFIPSELPELALAEGELRGDLEIAMDGGLSISGKVSEAATGKEIPGARVLFRFLPPDRKENEHLSKDEKETTSLPGGLFALKGLRPGEYGIRCWAEGFLSSASQLVLEAPAGGEASTVRDLTLEPGSVIAGRVLDEDGGPIPEAEVTLSRDENGFVHSVGTVKTDRQGRYELNALPPNAAYVVKASDATHAPASSKLALKENEESRQVDLSLLRATGIRGTIHAPDGKPIARASLEASGKATKPPSDYFTSKASSDVAGVYELRNLPPGAYSVEAWAAGWKAETKPETAVEEGAFTVLDLTLRPNRKAVAVRVVDASGQPIEGAEVAVLEGAWDHEVIAGSSDKRGRCNLEWGGGGTDLKLRAKKPTFEAAEAPISVPAGEVTLKLERSAVLSGTVRASECAVFRKLEVQAFEVEVRGRKRSRDGRAALHLESSGRFEVAVAAGTHILEAIAHGFGPGMTREVQVKAGERREGLVIDLVPEARLEGRIVRRGSGEPVSEASVTVHPVNWVEDRYPKVYSGADGSYALSALPAGVLDLLVSYGLGRSKRIAGISIGSGEARKIDIEVGDTGRIQGIVRQGGRTPQERAREILITGGRDGSTVEVRPDVGPDGRFAVDGLPAGDYLLRSDHASFEAERFYSPSLTCGKRVTVRENAITEVDLDLRPSVRLVGRVTSNGDPVTGAAITVRDAARDWFAYRRFLDSEGGFLFHVPGPGVYQLDLYGFKGGSVSSEVVVPEGVEELPVTIEFPGGSLSGIVLDAATGASVLNASIEVYLAANRDLLDRWETEVSSESTSDGRFHFLHLPAGTLDLYVRAEGYAWRVLRDIQVDERKVADELKIALEPAVLARFRVLDPNGIPVENARCFVRDQGGSVGSRAHFSERDGLVIVNDLKAGTYSITVLHPFYAPARLALEIFEGASAATIRLRTGGDARLQVSGEDGAPVEYAHVMVRDAEGMDMDQVLRMRNLPSRSALITDDGGGFDLTHLAPGVYRVHTRKDSSRSAEETFTIEEGRTVELELRLLDPRRR